MTTQNFPSVYLPNFFSMNRGSFKELKCYSESLPPTPLTSRNNRSVQRKNIKGLNHRFQTLQNLFLVNKVACNWFFTFSFSNFLLKKATAEMGILKNKPSQSLKMCIFLSYGMEDSPNSLVIVLLEDKVKMRVKSTFYLNNSSR